MRSALTAAREASQSKSARTSLISRGPSTETSPPDSPCPRASKVRTAYRRGGGHEEDGCRGEKKRPAHSRKGTPRIFFRGFAARRRLRLGYGRADRPSRVSRDDAARGLPLPRRPRPAPVRSPSARRDPALRRRDRGLPRGARREAGRRRLQRRHLGRAAGAPGAARGADRRRDHARGARGRAGDAQPADRAARDAGDGHRRALRRARTDPRRGRAALPRRLPAARTPHRERRALRRRDGCRRPRVRGAAEAGGRRHGHPRLHALPADPSDLPARLRSQRHARLLGGGDRARGRGDARAQGDRERAGPGRRVPLPDDGRPGPLPRDRGALPAAAARRGGAGEHRGARGGRRLMRADGRRSDDLRMLEIEPDYLEQAHGSALISCGRTRVLCTASLEEGVPRWLSGSGRGWLTAEYSMLPASTGSRTPREASLGRQKGRTVEIQRLIGRAIRAVGDLEALGDRTLWLDCDVLQADGGTRCAAISGAYVAARRALDHVGLGRALADSVAAVSVGMVAGEPLLDLDYEEDSAAEVDVNVVMAGDGRLIEVQATAERAPLDRAQLDELLDLAAAGIEEIGLAQRGAVEAVRA